MPGRKLFQVQIIFETEKTIKSSSKELLCCLPAGLSTYLYLLLRDRSREIHT